MPAAVRHGEVDRQRNADTDCGLGVDIACRSFVVPTPILVEASILVAAESSESSHVAAGQTDRTRLKNLLTGRASLRRLSLQEIYYPVS